ncbi:DNA gyrase inhibitor YacG [Neiella marina]|uniref:DNA gyrase inhibitor YacG n=1 Tax=Neiella holothuriorum TaxID=2870530 RepID=A0ABS7EB38_9GAMM|nr:DNA gyrase inhibitor YacG [Neiella holothuriorum]MBW8189546.1 DNA gyrase inhibitor YacG [Neiella holothuriorum]
MKVSCPTCQAQVEWSTANQYRPFCSERCKLIDLGEWADESHRIAGEPDRQQIENMSDEELMEMMAKMQVPPKK